MAATKKTAPKMNLVREVKAKGRPSGASKTTLTRFANIDTVVKGAKVTITDRVKGADGNVTEKRWTGWAIDNGNVGVPTTYTGMPGLVAAWAKSRGRSVSCVNVNGFFVIRDKG